MNSEIQLGRRSYYYLLIVPFSLLFFSFIFSNKNWRVKPDSDVIKIKEGETAPISGVLMSDEYYHKIINLRCSDTPYEITIK